MSCPANGQLPPQSRVRRGLAPCAALFLALLTASVCDAQGTTLNNTQQELLTLEAGAKPFINFQVTLVELQVMKSASPAWNAQLAAAKDKANTLLAQAQALQAKAHSLSGNLYVEPGVELDYKMMYRVSAWDLNVYYGDWVIILDRVIKSASTSPVGTWSTDLLGSHYEDAKIYRILGNQQFEIDRALH